MRNREYVACGKTVQRTEKSQNSYQFKIPILKFSNS